MRIGVLANSKSWYLSDLVRAANARHTIVPLSFELLEAELAGANSCVSCGGQALESVDAILVRTMPPGSLEQVVLRMDLLGQLHAQGTAVWNSPRSIECAVDKYLTSVRLQAAGLPTPSTRVCQTEEQALLAFDALGCDVVVKPLFGSEGRGMTRVSDRDLAQRAFRLLEQMRAVIYLQQFVPHEGGDIRILLVGSEVFAMRRRNALDWRSNVSRGATAEPLRPSERMVEMARVAARAVGAAIAGVDLLPGLDGELYAIEVNAVPGWKALARVAQVDIAARVLTCVEQSPES